MEVAQMVKRSAQGQETSLRIDSPNAQVLLNDCVVGLTATEYRILVLLTSQPGQLFSRREIIDASLGPASPSTEATIDVHICRLRKKLGACGDRIETIRGEGFRFRKEPEDPPAGCRC